MRLSLLEAFNQLNSICSPDWIELFRGKRLRVMAQVEKVNNCLFLQLGDAFHIEDIKFYCEKGIHARPVNIEMPLLPLTVRVMPDFRQVYQRLFGSSKGLTPASSQNLPRKYFSLSTTALNPGK